MHMQQSLNFNSIILENERVRLEPLQEEHFSSLVRFSLEEPSLWNYALQAGDSPEKMKIYIDSAIQDRLSGYAIPYLVIDKRTNTVAGSTRFYSINWFQKTASIGYTWYGKDYQRTHVNSNCKFLMLEAAFEQMGMERIEFRADALNTASIDSIKRLGAQIEGVLRQNMIRPDGTRRDSIVLSILKEEWFNTLKFNLLNRC